MNMPSMTGKKYTVSTNSDLTYSEVADSNLYTVLGNFSKYISFKFMLYIK